MNDYNKYVTAINKIFELAGKLKNGWNNNDNLGFIEELEDNKQIVIMNANKFSKTSNTNASAVPQNSTTTKTLGNTSTNEPEVLG